MVYLVDYVGVEEVEILLIWMELILGFSVNLKYCKYVYLVVL